MRQSLLLLILSGPLLAGEPAYPLWDGQESVADYAKRVNLAPTQTLDLVNGVKLELVLIPAGQFIMGAPEPTPVDEEGFHKKIIIGQALSAVSAIVLLVVVIVVTVAAIRKKRRPQFSLGLLLLFTVAAGGCVLSQLHWRRTAQSLEAAMSEYPAAQKRYRDSCVNEKPAHPVSLTKPYYMGRFAVTQEQYLQVPIKNIRSFTGKDNNPADMLSWDDAQAFCNAASACTGQSIRLPTEAEWEFACRAGTTTAYYSGDAEYDLARVAWYSANCSGSTHPVGLKAPNAFGLYDMHGNVWQWCQDFYDCDYYQISDAENPHGPARGSSHVLRGGSANTDAWWCRSGSRHVLFQDRIREIGFRIVVAPASTTP